MKTKLVLISALLAGGTAFATGDASTSYDSSRDEKRESAYDSAIKPDRTMRHNTRQSRAAAEYDQNQYDLDRRNQDMNTRDRTMDQGPATRE